MINQPQARHPQANIYDNIFDLSGPGPFVFGVPAGAKGFVFVFEANVAGNATGTVGVFLGQSSGSLTSRLALVKANTIRTGSVSDPIGETSFVLQPSTGAQGILRVKFTTGDQPEASYSL